MKKQKWIAMLLAGGKGTRLEQLTQTIVKPAIPFGGKYRIIDFALSNCRNSGIETIGILTHYKPLALQTYLRNCQQCETYGPSDGLQILPHLQEQGIEFHEGTSHAVFQYIEFIEQYNPEYVLILAADQIYKMDYNLMLKQHLETGADCTIAVVNVPQKEAHRFGIIKLNKKTNKIEEFEEKPIEPSSTAASMGIYIFNWQILKDYLLREEEKECTHRDFGKDIIPSMLKDHLNLYAYSFHHYWKDVGTVHSYWQANLDLLDVKKNIFLQNPAWKIYAVNVYKPPIYLDKSANVQHSIIGEGCEINGIVEGSIIFSGVKIKKGSIIKNSVILAETIIEENVWIENAVIGCESVIKEGVIIVSKSPEIHVMVVGNQTTVGPKYSYIEFQKDIHSASS